MLAIYRLRWLMSQLTPSMTKKEANYRGASRASKSCGNAPCDMWVETGERQGKCTLVVGAIDRMGTCDYWERKK